MITGHRSRTGSVCQSKRIPLRRSSNHFSLSRVLSGRLLYVKFTIKATESNRRTRWCLLTELLSGMLAFYLYMCFILIDIQIYAFNFLRQDHSNHHWHPEMMFLSQITGLRIATSSLFHISQHHPPRLRRSHCQQAATKSSAHWRAFSPLAALFPPLSEPME